jgi:hypothetical protein
MSVIAPSGSVASFESYNRLYAPQRDDQEHQAESATLVGDGPRGFSIPSVVSTAAVISRYFIVPARNRRELSRNLSDVIPPCRFGVIRAAPEWPMS